MDYADPTQIESFLLQRLSEKTERDKLDLKRDLLGWDSRGDKESQMNFVRLVSAFANTSTDEFDDYGFLIYGADKEDGDVIYDVAVLRTKGPDKLHAEMGQQLARYLFPVPRFEIYSFERNEKTWGAVVIEPMTQGPSVFIRESTGWRVGEWRVRRGARTEMPTADDYRRMQQGWIAPLEQKIRRLEREADTARGELQARAAAAIPSIKVGPSAISRQLRHPDAEFDRNWKVLSALGELQMLVSKIHTAPRTRVLNDERARRNKELAQVKLDSVLDTGLSRALLQVPLIAPGIFSPRPFKVSEARIDKLLQGLEEAKVSARREDYVFPSLTRLGRMHEFDHDKWGGDDLERFRWFCKLEKILPEWRFHRNEAIKLMNCFEIPVALKNDGPVAVDDLTIEVSVAEGNALRILASLPYHGEYQPPEDAQQPQWMKQITVSPRPSGPARLDRVSAWTEDLRSVRPGDEVTLQVPVDALKAGTTELRIRVRGRNLPQPLLYSLQVHLEAAVVPKPNK